MNAKVVSINLHERHGEHPRAVSQASAHVGGGVIGDSHAHRENRAVVVVDRSILDALGLESGDLREQITIEGLPDVTRLAPGTELRIGGVTMRVNGECEPCTHIGELNDQADALAFQASLKGRRGANCTVIAADAPIRVGDAVQVLARALAPAPKHHPIVAVPQPSPPLRSRHVSERVATSSAAASKDEA